MKLQVFVLWMSLASLVGVTAVDFPALDVLKPKTSPKTQASTVSAMVQRVVGSRSKEFSIDVDPTLVVKGKDAFKIQTVGSMLRITGSSGVAAAMGFNYYLKTYCYSMFTWGGENIDLHSPLPAVPTAVIVNTLDRFRYYQNVVTVSYSSPFWDWPRWERHLDWMAMNGINLPLAFTGQEAILQRLYLNMGFTHGDLDAFFGGPAFLAWARMGNIQGWGGPLPQLWMMEKLILQHQILQRMRDFGMIPVLPAFAGHVPAAITRLFPNVNVSRLGSWNNFNETYSSTFLLDFSDPLFEKIGSQFISLMESEFGVDHVYNADSFNEMTPKSNSTEYLSTAGKAVFSAMVKADPDAVWLMQGWLFVTDRSFWQPAQVNALVNSVPRGRMVILDLYSEMVPGFVASKSYYGQPFIWCMLHNFGGTMEMYGALEAVNEGPDYGRKFMENSTMVGIGLTMEGIFQNEMVYEFMMENAYIASRNITTWISGYAKRRYNFTSPAIDTAWQLLKVSIYDCKNGHHDFDYTLITKRPQLNYKNNTDLWYDPEQLYQAWDSLLLGVDQFKPNELFLYDLVDVSRQSLQILALTYYYQIVEAYDNNDTKSLDAAGNHIVGLLTDMDTLLASDRHFLLGTWLSDASTYAPDLSEDYLLLQNNARNQITIWGPNGEIVDYASKQWSGLFKDYYVSRWQFFVNWLEQLITNGTKFDSAVFNKAVFDQVELPFTLLLQQYPKEPTGDTVAIVKQLHQKYRKVFDRKFYQRLHSTYSPKVASQRLANFLHRRGTGQF